MLSHLPRLAIIAHRGASLYAPENTLPAFELAIQESADAVELDVKLSLDQAVVVIHDQTVDRTTNGAGRVDKLPLADLLQLDAGTSFGEAYRGAHIPTLEEVFEIVGQQILINIELTNYATPTDQLAVQVAELVRKSAMENRVLFSSFNPLTLLRISRLLPGVPRGLLAVKGAGGAWARSWLGSLIPHQALHPDKGDTTGRLIAKAHKRSRRVYTYTVNKQDEMRTLFRMGIDGIFTDDPQLAREIRTEFIE
jgi:glycerophosphoryl diester phosphodiesterase